MNKRRNLEPYQVTFGLRDPIGVMARSPGHAARKVFRVLINCKVLKRQPKTDADGGWEGVSIK